MTKWKKISLIYFQASSSRQRFPLSFILQEQRGTGFSLEEALFEIMQAQRTLREYLIEYHWSSAEDVRFAREVSGRISELRVG